MITAYRDPETSVLHHTFKNTIFYLHNGQTKHVNRTGIAFTETI